jgi:hypothetical protein
MRPAAPGLKLVYKTCIERNVVSTKETYEAAHDRRKDEPVQTGPYRFFQSWLAMSRAFLVATARNEAPYFLEWVAHHIEVGFTDIVIYQNDSDDLTHETLSSLRDIGAIRYFYNRAKPGAHQVRAYTRAAALPEYAEADWAMALDMDEFLVVKAGQGRLRDLLAASPATDCIHVNWRMFGNAGQLVPTDDLVTERFRLANWQLGGEDDFGAYKCLFRPGLFARPGIHRPADPKRPIEEIAISNGSGLPLGDYKVRNYNSTDPGGCRLAQINHYITRDLASFMLKGQRGSAHQSNRPIGRRYWTQRNRNHETDTAVLRFLPRIRARMQMLDQASGGKLGKLRQQALDLHLDRFRAMVELPDHARFHAFCLARSGMPAAPETAKEDQMPERLRKTG